MTTRDVVQSYFDCLKAKRGWEAFLADEMEFTSFTNPIKRVKGRGAYLEATKRFYSMIKTLEIQGPIIVDRRKSLRSDPIRTSATSWPRVREPRRGSIRSAK